MSEIKHIHWATFVTGNQYKIKQLQKLLGATIECFAMDLPELQGSLTDIVNAKARAAYAILNKPVLVEDSSLTFEALGSVPGPFVKWHLNQPGSLGMCRMLDGFDNRRAVAQATYGFFDGQGDVQLFEGAVHGTIAHQPIGQGAYYSDIFVPDGQTLTWAQMSAEQALATGTRIKPVKEILVTLA